MVSRVLGRGYNTVSYEVKTNGGVTGYNPLNADIYARTRKKDTRREWSKIEHNTEMKAYIIECLEKHWNPDEISTKMKLEKKPWYASKTVIYEWLWSVYGQQYCVNLYSQRYHTKKHQKKTDRVMIPNRVGLNERFLGADNRTRYGHWEYDTIVSRKGCSGGLSVGIDRKARLVVATVVTSMSTGEHMEAIQTHLSEYKTLSATFDNGSENTGYVRLKKVFEVFGMDTFFTDPYSSWQRGGNGNANLWIRYYFPKKTDFSTIEDDELRDVERELNNRPRKRLGFMTPQEVFDKHLNLP